MQVAALLLSPGFHAASLAAGLILGLLSQWLLPELLTQVDELLRLPPAIRSFLVPEASSLGNPTASWSGTLRYESCCRWLSQASGQSYMACDWALWSGSGIFLVFYIYIYIYIYIKM